MEKFIKNCNSGFVFVLFIMKVAWFFIGKVTQLYKNKINKTKLAWKCIFWQNKNALGFNNYKPMRIVIYTNFGVQTKRNSDRLVVFGIITDGSSILFMSGPQCMYMWLGCVTHKFYEANKLSTLTCRLVDPFLKKVPTICLL